MRADSLEGLPGNTILDINFLNYLHGLQNDISYNEVQSLHFFTELPLSSPSWIALVIVVEELILLVLSLGMVRDEVPQLPTKI